MKISVTYAVQAKDLLVLGLPIIGSHLAQMLLHVTDTVLLGWYGVNELAAVVLGTSMFFVVFILGSGFGISVMGMVASALGRGDETQVRRETRMGLWLSILYSLLIVPLFWWSGPLLLSFGQKPEVAALAQDFLRIAGFGMMPALLIMTLKSYLAALEKTQVVLWVTLAAVLVNAAVAWSFIFGRLGAPELGVRGRPSHRWPLRSSPSFFWRFMRPCRKVAAASTCSNASGARTGARLPGSCGWACRSG